MSVRDRFDPYRSGLFTDLYELTMMQAYYAEGMQADAVFELFFRKMPDNRNYVMAAGLDDVLSFIENLYFTAEDCDWLRAQGHFSEAFLQQLEGLRFTGEVYAVPEGTIVFEQEPVLQVVAPLPQAQLLETYLLNQIHVQSLVTTKAGRIVKAAQGRGVIDFGSRRSHGSDAALKMARDSYLAGCAGTSNVAASRLFEIPMFGTMAHSYIQAHANEMDAFRAFSREFPNTTLLVDTYDTLAGVDNVIALAQELGDDFQVQAVRLDSGDLENLSKQARQRLDAAGLTHIRITASSSLDEYRITDLLAAGAPIDGFGVGTKLAVSEDTPDIDFSYKLVAYDNAPCMKLSSAKLNYPGRKQVYRVSENGQMIRDTVALHDEDHEGEPLLQPVLRGDKRLKAGTVSLTEAREHARAQLEALPAEYHALERCEQPYPVTASKRLRDTAEQLRNTLEQAIRQ